MSVLKRGREHHTKMVRDGCMEEVATSIRLYFKDLQHKRIIGGELKKRAQDDIVCASVLLN